MVFGASVPPATYLDNLVRDLPEDYRSQSMVTELERLAARLETRRDSMAPQESRTSISNMLHMVQMLIVSMKRLLVEAN